MVAMFFFSSSPDFRGGFIMLGGALRTLGLGPTPGGGGSPGGKTPGGPDGGLIILGGGTPIIFHTNISISKICQITSRIKIYLE